MIADIKKSAEQKMQKSVEALKHDLGKVRTGRAHTGLLDHLHVDYYGTPMPITQVRERHAGRRAHDHRAAVGEEDDPGDREGDPRLRPRPESGDVRRRDPRADAGAHRGAPQGADQGRAPRGRGRAHRGAQHPPRRQRAPEEAAEGPRGARRTTSATRRPTCRSSPTASSPRSTRCSRRRKRT